MTVPYTDRRKTLGGRPDVDDVTTIADQALDDGLAPGALRAIDAFARGIPDALAFEPLGDRLVILPDTPPEKTSSGLVIVESAKEAPVVGTVVAAGPGRRSEEGELVAMTVAVGDRVLYGSYSGTQTTIEGRPYLVIREDDIIGRFPASAR